MKPEYIKKVELNTDLKTGILYVQLLGMVV